MGQWCRSGRLGWPGHGPVWRGTAGAGLGQWCGCGLAGRHTSTAAAGSGQWHELARAEPDLVPELEEHGAVATADAARHVREPGLGQERRAGALQPEPAEVRRQPEHRRHLESALAHDDAPGRRRDVLRRLAAPAGGAGDGSEDPVLRARARHEFPHRRAQPVPGADAQRQPDQSARWRQYTASAGAGARPSARAGAADSGPGAAARTVAGATGATPDTCRGAYFHYSTRRRGRAATARPERLVRPGVEPG